jgi:hypothetical protein
VKRVVDSIVESVARTSVTLEVLPPPTYSFRWLLCVRWLLLSACYCFPLDIADHWLLLFIGYCCQLAIAVHWLLLSAGYCYPHVCRDGGRTFQQTLILYIYRIETV